MKRQVDGDKNHNQMLKDLINELDESSKKKENEILILNQRFSQNDDRKHNQHLTLVSTMADDRFLDLNTQIYNQRRTIKTLQATITDLSQEFMQAQDPKKSEE